MKIQIKSVFAAILFEGDFSDLKECVLVTVKSGANLYGADLSGAKVTAMRVFSGLYKHTVQAVLFEDASRWVRMGCLFYALEEWEKIGIAKSNLKEFPDDGSDASLERIAAFEFAKAAALRLK